MAKKIVTYPNKILIRKCAEIKEITPNIKALAKELIESLIKSQGLGLAAPQIGESKSIIAVWAEEGAQVFINPKIIKKSRKKEIGEEGCLSFPGLYLKIKRAQKVEVEALTLQGEKIKLITQDLAARVFQHEIDHLNGILFIDRVGFWQRMKIKRKLRRN